MDSSWSNDQLTNGLRRIFDPARKARWPRPFSLNVEQTNGSSTRLLLIRLFQQTTRCRVPTTRPTTAGWALLKRPDKHEQSNGKVEKFLCVLWQLQVLRESTILVSFRFAFRRAVFVQALTHSSPPNLRM